MVATVGTAGTAVGTAIIAGGAVVTSTVVGAPEGAAVMVTGAGIAEAGTAYTAVGLGMQGVGSVINAARGSWFSLASFGVQGLATAIDWGANKIFPGLPDLMGPYNPVDVAADAVGDRLNGGGMCP